MYINCLKKYFLWEDLNCQNWPHISAFNKCPCSSTAVLLILNQHTTSQSIVHDKVVPASHNLFNLRFLSCGIFFSLFYLSYDFKWQPLIFLSWSKKVHRQNWKGMLMCLHLINEFYINTLKQHMFIFQPIILRDTLYNTFPCFTLCTTLCP